MGVFSQEVSPEITKNRDPCLCFFQVMLDPQIQAIQNLGTALITMGAGSIVDEYDKYEKFTVAYEFPRIWQI